MYIIFRNLTSEDKKRTSHIEAINRRRKSMIDDVRKSSSIDELVNCVQLDHEKKIELLFLYVKFTDYSKHQVCLTFTMY
jgi:hypothetical protein